MAEDSDKNEAMTFEQALGQLEALVDSMESGEVPLAELVEKYSAGNKLLKTCQKHLQQAELRIQLLQKEGNLTDFEADEA